MLRDWKFENGKWKKNITVLCWQKTCQKTLTEKSKDHNDKQPFVLHQCLSVCLSITEHCLVTQVSVKFMEINFLSSSLLLWRMTKIRHDSVLYYDWILAINVQFWTKNPKSKLSSNQSTLWGCIFSFSFFFTFFCSFFVYFLFFIHSFIHRIFVKSQEISIHNSRKLMLFLQNSKWLETEQSGRLEQKAAYWLSFL